jgi:hypothetical protein
VPFQPLNKNFKIPSPLPNNDQTSMTRILDRVWVYERLGYWGIGNLDLFGICDLIIGI